MSTTSGVLTGLSTPVVYRQMSDEMGILVGSRFKPRCLLPGSRGYYLGLHDSRWYNVAARPTGTATYYVQIVPMWSEIVDPDAVPLLGTANAENSTAGTSFTFDPFPDGYACDGYRVYAGTVSGVLYYQGELSGRFNTSFTVGTTWTLNTTGDALSAQTIGPPCFANALEVFEAQGAVNSRIFLGGGKQYDTGYARVAKTTSAPSLVCGVAGSAVFGTWAAVTDASFRMMLGWSESSLDYEQEFDFDEISFAGDGSMADVATTLQTALRAARHPALYCGTGATTTVATWAAISDGSFDIYVDGVVVHVVNVDFTGDTTMANVAASIQTAMQAMGGTLAAATCVWDTTALIFVVKANNGTAAATSLLSYLFPNSAGTGTDISEAMKGRETSTAVHLVKRGKGATTTGQTVAWSTDHFNFTSASTGQQYRFSYLTTASVGTDISTASWLNALVTSMACVYTPGLTALRSVQGDGTDWGEWAEGMRFRINDSSSEFLVGRIYDVDLLTLDSDYSGDGFFGWKEYILAPYNDQVYISALHNPFKYSSSDIVQTPTADGDGITAIRRNNGKVAVFMDHHIWAFDGVSIEAPEMISNVWGAKNTASCVEYGVGLTVFTGQDFILIVGGEIRKLDPDARMRQYLDRLSPYFTDYHGVFDDSENKQVIKWFVGLDNSFVANTCFVLDPTTGNWWLHNVKDAASSAIIRNTINEKYLVTGSTYDSGHSIKAWMHLWGKDYHADGAVNSALYDRDGIIGSVGAATTTAGYLTCGTNGALLAAWQAVTAGYFSVTIDDIEYDIGPVDFSTAASLGTTAPSVASLLQTAIRAATNGSEVVAYASNYFTITSGTTTARSNVSYLRPYRPVATMTDLSGKTMLNGREDHGTKTGAVTQRVLNLNNWSDVAATLYTTGDGEEGVWVYVCDSDFRNGQYARVVSNTATAITVTPNFSTTPAAGWYWYVGGIVPSWTKWLDWGSPQHHNKIHGIAITTRQDEGTDGNTLAVHQMQDLNTTIRVTKTMPLGSGNDSTQTVNPADKNANQHGVKLMRPSSVHDLKIDDITISHRPRV